MKVRFIGSGELGEDEICVVFGHSFPLGDAVTVSAEIGRKLAGNPAFETVGRQPKHNA